MVIQEQSTIMISRVRPAVKPFTFKFMAVFTYEMLVAVLSAGLPVVELAAPGWAAAVAVDVEPATVEGIVVFRSAKPIRL